ncbi:hypothetical protein PAMP_003485 [Pampus punctatissimus]
MMEAPEAAQLCFPQLLNNSCRKPMRPQSDVYTLISFVSLSTVTLNLLVIISISHFRQLHNPTNLLIASLAISDLLSGAILIPLRIFITRTCWFLGDFMCAMCSVIILIITSSAFGNMVLISIDRYLAICDPLQYITKVTLERTKISVCLCWICSVIYNSLISVNLLTEIGLNSCYGECVYVTNSITGTVDFVFSFISPITVIIFLYMRVFLVAASQARAMRSHIATVTQHSVKVTAKKSELKAASTLGIIVVVFLICIIPYYFPVIGGQAIESSSSAFPLSSWLFYLNSCLNPVIYAFFYPWFRKCVKLIVTLQILQPDSCDVRIF